MKQPTAESDPNGETMHPTRQQPTGTTGTLRAHRSGAIATITIDNPRRRNALTKEMWAQFAPMLDRFAADPSVRVVVVRGAGKNFSAGADISDLKNILVDSASGQFDGGEVTAAETALASFPKLTIAAIDGFCLGGAWQIAGACDLRIATERAVFGITPAKIGIVYPTSGIQRLVQLVGPAVAKQLLLTVDFIDADAAIRAGLVGQLISGEEFETATTQFAERMALRSAFSVQAMKDIIDTIVAAPEQLEKVSSAWHQEMAVSEDPNIGVQAFLQKNTPQFTWSHPSENFVQRE